MNGVQRFLSGHKNEVRTAAALTGPVKTILDAVIQKPIARQGSSSALIDGTYSGNEEANYEIEILDTVPTVPLITAPIFSGVGNGDLSGVTSTGLGARDIEIELTDLGNILTAASSELQGVSVIVKVAGASGNAFKLRVDRSGLVFTPQAFSLLSPLKQGTSAVEGPEFDWDTKFMGSDGVVPASAHRIAFGDDQNNVYIQYKKKVNGEFSYVFEPSLAQDYAVKTIVSFVTGTYTVRLYEVVASVDTLRETYVGIVTLYDLLNAIKTTSTRLLIQGAIAFDRTTGGQALLELSLNTDARYVSNTGVGSAFATGYTDVTIDPTSPTELIEATCIAATFRDSPGAGLGHELWEVRGSVSGLISSGVASGDLISTPTFDARIPQRVPDGYSVLPKGSFTKKEVDYSTKRVDNGDGTFTPPQPPICVDSMTLGLNASEQLITLVYKKRPAQDACGCTDDNTTPLDANCLGIITSTGGGIMTYSAATVTRLEALYDWFATTVRNNSAYFSDSGVTSNPTGPYVQQDPFISQPANNPLFLTKTNFAYVSLFAMIGKFEETIALVDKLIAGAYRTAAETAFDTAVTEFKADVDTNLTGAGTPAQAESEVLNAYEALTAGDAVCVFETAAATFKIRKAVNGGIRYGFVKAAFALGAPATIFYFGEDTSVVSTEASINAAAINVWQYYPSVANPGHWVLNKGVSTSGDPAYFNQFSLQYVSATSGVKVGPATVANVYGVALLADRYRARLQHVLIAGGISPLGKGNASDNVSGDGCWQDMGGDFWWEVTGGDGDSYAPAFTGIPYYSAKKFPGGVVVNGITTPSAGYYSTKEFGFVVDVPCAANLVVGDTIVLKIGNATTDMTYQKGDKLQLGIVAAQDIAFFGGNDGDNIQTWFVTDSVFGPRTPYLLDLDTPLPYDDGSIHFQIDAGTLPFGKGDKFKFSIEGGHFQWRKVVAGVPGAWSASTPIVITPIVLDSGLSLHFTLGTSPAFFATDLYTFTALQPYAISNIIKPDFDMWQWGAADPAVGVFDLGANKTIEAVGIAFHSIPAGATVTLEGGVAPGVYIWLEAVVWQKDVMGKLLAAAQIARYLRLTITGGANGGIGWFYAGVALKFTYSAQVQINREYKVNRSSGVNPASVFKGKAVGSGIQWPEGNLHENDYAPLLEMLDWLKSNDDEALMFFPQQTRQTEIVLGTVESDAITFNDVYNFQPDTGFARRLSCTIPLKGVAFR
jgi:hypothetical protein